MEQVKGIKEEMDDMRGRPHKKPTKDEEMESLGSWKPIHES